MFKRYLWAVVLILALVMTSCGGDAAPAPTTEVLEPPAAEPDAEMPAGKYSEAPMLAEMVAAGDLPPVDERLPAVPFVVDKGALISAEDLPDWTPGKYGGTLRLGHSSANWNPDVFVMMDEAILQGQGIGMEGIQGNVVESFQTVWRAPAPKEIVTPSLP